MTIDFLNPLMLVGLAAIVLPVLIHLLSRKRYDVVEWGAMPFLNLGQQVRRRLRLEELLLLLLRMGLVSLVVMALARPRMPGGIFSPEIARGPRDVVLVIDGSYSMGWQADAGTPHAAALRWARRFVDELKPDDAVALVDCREQARTLIHTPTSDFRLVRRNLDELPPPAGGSDLAAAVAEAVTITGRGSHRSREIIVLTDGQARPWRSDDIAAWSRVDALRAEAAVPPRIRVIVVDQPHTPHVGHAGLDRLRASRDLAVVGLPIRLSTSVRSYASDAAINNRVRLEVNGQQLVEPSRSVELEPGQQERIDFEYRFQSAGSHLLSAVLDDDRLPGDNRADVAVTVLDALPVLLVDGDPQPDPTRNETFFARPALTADANEAPWVQAHVVPWDRLPAIDLKSYRVIVLANVPRINQRLAESLETYVADGGGLFFALGDKIDKDVYNRLLYRNGNGPMPASLNETAQVKRDDLKVGLTAASLSRSGLIPREDNESSDLTDVRFSKWWIVTPASSAVRPAGAADADEAAAGQPVQPHVSGALAAAGDNLVIIRLNTADPLVLSRRFGRGKVVLLTVPLDADWSTLPTKRDYVPLLHELILGLAIEPTSRNVDTGEPLSMPVSPDFAVDAHIFRGPGTIEFPPRQFGALHARSVRLDDTRLPGPYRLVQKTDDAAAEPASPVAYFVVHGDREESDLTPLEPASRRLLEQHERMSFAAADALLEPDEPASRPPIEVWHIVLLLFVLLLVSELWITRRLVQGGHVYVEETDVQTS